MKLFDWSLKINGYNIDRAKKQLNAILSIPEFEYPQYIFQKRKDILSYHLEHNEFYKKLVGSRDLTNWDDVPILTKRNFQKPLEERLSEGYTIKNCFINKTSGSSGDPFVFAKDKICHALTWAEILHRFSWYDIDFNSSRQARFYGIPLNKMGYYKERLKDFLSHRYRFPVFDLSDEAFNRALSKFGTTDFEYLNGYTSSLVQFAKYLRRINLILKEVCPTLNVCIVTSEMLFDDDKKLMEEQFGIPVVNEYGASELDLIAFQNPNDEWVANSETLYIEILNEENKPVANGEEGRVVITSLYNKAHPFIRYDIGDVGVLSKKSTPKKPILEKLIGRTNDIAILPSGKKSAGLTFYYITKSIIEDDGNVKEFVIEQLTKEKFLINYVSETAISEEKKVQIKNEMERYLEPGLMVSFEKLDTLDRSNRGKLKQFISHISQQSQ